MLNTTSPVVTPPSGTNPTASPSKGPCRPPGPATEHLRPHRVTSPSQNDDLTGCHRMASPAPQDQTAPRGVARPTVACARVVGPRGFGVQHHEVGGPAGFDRPPWLAPNPASAAGRHDSSASAVANGRPRGPKARPSATSSPIAPGSALSMGNSLAIAATGVWPEINTSRSPVASAAATAARSASGRSGGSKQNCGS